MFTVNITDLNIICNLDDLLILHNGFLFRTGRQFVIVKSMRFFQDTHFEEG